MTCNGILNYNFPGKVFVQRKQVFVMMQMSDCFKSCSSSSPLHHLLKGNMRNYEKEENMKLQVLLNLCQEKRCVTEGTKKSGVCVL